MNVSKTDALKMLKEYREHRGSYDKLDWEIERIARQIAKGKTVISVASAIREAGLDEQGRPKLAICRADAPNGVHCSHWGQGVFHFTARSSTARWIERIPILVPSKSVYVSSPLPRIPPQYRPAKRHLGRYWILWEANWTDVDPDPYLLRRIGKDAWVVVAAWDLTDLEVSVLRAHRRTN